MFAFFLALWCATTPRLHHYVFFNLDRERIADSVFLNTAAFEGAQLKYSWRELEPARDQYDFSAIRRDLTFLESHQKKLFIQLQDVSFDPARKNVPDYLLHDVEYHGGAAATYFIPQGEKEPKVGGWVARRWDPAVRQRFARLLDRLGREFDGRIEGINLPETSIGWDEFPNAVPEGFTPAAYRDGVIANMTALRRAFKKSVVLQYANFMPGEWLPADDRGYLKDVFAAARRLRVSVGGPDLLPTRRGQMNHSYPLIRAARAATPNGIAVQEGNYAQIDSKTGRRVTVGELVGFATDYLGVTYMFWFPEEPFFTRDVLPFMRAGAAVPAPAKAQSQLTGRWQGYWSRAGDSMLVTMHVQRDATSGIYSATFDAERLRVSGIPFAKVDVKGCCDVVMELRGDRTTTVFNGRVRRDSLTGTLREGASEGRFAYARVGAAAPTFEEKAVTFMNGAVTLAGSLLLPLKGDSLPAVVFLHGSGAEGRWASHFLASQLARSGIAALIFDKRGVGSSTGDWRQATLDDVAGYAAAAVAWLGLEPRINPRRIGIHGHSQGGTLAPFIAARAPNVAFIIASAAAGVPTDSAEIFSVLNSILRAAASREDSTQARQYVAALVGVAYHGESRQRLDSLVAALRDRPWYFAPPAADNSYWTFSKMYGQYRPLEWWSRIRVPVLLVYGAQDQRVPAAESAARIAATLIRAGNGDVTVQVFPGADHTFRLPAGPSGWSVTAPGYVATLMDWLAKH